MPPPVEDILASSAGLTRFISQIGKPLSPLRPIKENQFELGVTQKVADLLRVGITSYYHISEDPPHTVLFPNSRFYAYTNFDKGKAYGMELKMEMANIPAVGLSGYLNYAVGRVWFYNPVTAGFITEAAHINEASKFLAPMDQTHTLTGGFTYRHRPTRLWTSITFEYSSGTPGEHGSGDDAHEAGVPAH